ncbi:MAG: SCO6880 family protein [Acidimicrobiia bacterium]
MAPEHEDRLYRFDPADGSGVFLGLGVAQCAFLGTGLVASVAAVSYGVVLPLAAVPALVATAASFARVGGRPAWEWLSVLAAWTTLRLGRGRRWLAPLALLPDEAGRPTPLPPCLDGVTIVDLPWRGRQRIGAVRDDGCHPHRRRAGVRAGLRRAAPGRAGAPGGRMGRRPQPVRGGGRARHPRGVVGPGRAVGTGGAPGLAGERRGREVHDEARASYDELLADATATATAHDVVVTLTVARDRLGRSGGADPDAALARVLASSTEALLRGARSAGLDASDPLSAAELQRALRTRIDPAAARPARVGGRLVDRLGMVGAAGAGPMALESSWRHVRVDAAFHRTWRVVAWPRLPVTPAWLEPFLSAPGVTRTMTVAFCPVSAYQSRRRIERDLVKLESDAATKEDKGRRVDARHRRATQALLDREQELVAGFAEMGYIGLVGVSARSEAELEEAAEITEQAAREAGMELRCLEARQDLAWASALPLGLAPKHLLAG